MGDGNIAGLQQNLGRSWGPCTQEKMTGSPPNPVFVDTAQSSARRVGQTQKRKSTEKAKESRRRSKYSQIDNSLAGRNAYSRHDDDVTPNDITDDVSPEYLDELKNSFYTMNVTLTIEQADKLEQETREQSGSDMWIRDRMKRITTSRGGILKMKITRRSKKVKEILYSKFKRNRATMYGTNMEETSRQQYTTYQHQKGQARLRTSKVGLVVSVDNPWLAASPDNKVHDSNALQPLDVVEYNNPYAARDLSLHEACNTLKSFCLERQEQKGQVTN